MDNTQIEHARDLGEKANEIVSQIGKDSSYTVRGERRVSMTFKGEVQIEKAVFMIKPEVYSLRVKYDRNVVLETHNSLKQIRSYVPGAWEEEIERLYGTLQA